MESAGRRHRAQVVKGDSPTPRCPSPMKKQQPKYKGPGFYDKGRGIRIPKFTIDLSMPPETRYDHIAPHFQDKVRRCGISDLFDGLLAEFVGPTLSKYLQTVASILLRRLYTDEETAEIRGISRAIGLPLYLLVAFNVLLDVLLGCTSGGVRVMDPSQSTQTSRILHLRTLDWGMEQLRELIMELDFVHYAGGPTVATSVTYLGYIGVLTGVRKGLSMSLNFRPRHDQSTWRARFSFRWHQAMVVLGFRPAMCSVLRQFLLGPLSSQTNAANNYSTDGKPKEAEENPDLSAILSALSHSPSTAAYLIFCTPEKVIIVEKDNHSAAIRSSDEFLVAYNHDAADEACPLRKPSQGDRTDRIEDITGMADIVDFSLERKSCMDHMHARLENAVTLSDIMDFVQDEEITNDETHYSVIMDPQAGKLLWSSKFDAC